jgi:hypothetical protein
LSRLLLGPNDAFRLVIIDDVNKGEGSAGGLRQQHGTPDRAVRTLGKIRRHKDPLHLLPFRDFLVWL